MNADTIAAIATASGRGSVGIVRISGPNAISIGKEITQISAPKNRYAYHCQFRNKALEIVDEGIAIFFESPASFTGENVVELQGHGGTIVLDMLLESALKLGARQARPGEFSERAFLNDKMDLTQAEAIADLIDASSTQAARQALASLQGNFSREVEHLLESLIKLRMYVEAAIDFPEEEIDFLADPIIQDQAKALLQDFDTISQAAQQGALIQNGINVVLAGRPNAGKSSLMNVLSDKDVAIVTDVKGTTRDTLRQTILMNGLPLHLIDTAGLRESEDKVEKIGIERAWSEINKADLILLVIDASDPEQQEPKKQWAEFTQNPDLLSKTLFIVNKIDLVQEAINKDFYEQSIEVSALSGKGISALKAQILEFAGFNDTGQSLVSARRRHLDALSRAKHHISEGLLQLSSLSAGELLAEELRQAQDCLGEITGRFTPDDLLGTIFSSFCIGK